MAETLDIEREKGVEGEIYGRPGEAEENINCRDRLVVCPYATVQRYVYV